MIGPAFSGESKAADAILEQGEIPNVTASATNPGLTRTGWKYFHRLVATDDPAGAGHRGLPDAHQVPKKAFVISDDQEYSVGIADYACKGFQATGVTVERDKFAQGASDYSSTVSQGQGGQPRRDLLRRVLRPGGQAAQAAARRRRDRHVRHRRRLARRGPISGAGEQAAEGAIVGCPCNIPFGSTDPKLKKFTDDYKAKFNPDPAIYSTEGYDAATAFINAIKAGTPTPRRSTTSWRRWSSTASRRRSSSSPTVSRTLATLRLQVGGRHFAPPATTARTRDQLTRTTAQGGRTRPRPPFLPSPRSGGRVRGLRRPVLVSTIDGLTIGSIYALVALGYTLVYGVLRLINFAHSEIFMIGMFATLVHAHHCSGRPARRAGLALVGRAALLPGRGHGGLRRRPWLSSASPTARCAGAARPASPRSSPRSACRCSSRSSSPWSHPAAAGSRTHQQRCPRAREERRCSPSAARVLRNDKLLVFVAAIVHDGRARPVRDRTRLGPRHPRHRAGRRDRRADGREHRPRRRAHLPPRRPMAGGAAVLYGIYFETPRSTSASSPASRRSPPRCSAASATSAARCSAASCSGCSRTTAPASSARSGRTSSPSSSWCSS